MSATSMVTFAKKSIGSSIVLSVLMIVAGILAIALPAGAGISAELLVAWLMVLSGCAHLAFSRNMRSTGGSVWELLVGILYIFIGAYLVFHPVAGLASLTIGLALYLFLEAVLEFVMGVTLRPLPGSGWLFVDGAVTLMLADLIWRTWPSSTEFVIGMLIGISMLSSGFARLGISLATRGVASKLLA